MSTAGRLASMGFRRAESTAPYEPSVCSGTFMPPAGDARATKPHHVDTLKHIALLGGVKAFVPLSSAALGEKLGMSQQSAAERILALLGGGLVPRGQGGGGG